jgi:hypothetical protein
LNAPTGFDRLAGSPAKTVPVAAYDETTLPEPSYTAAEVDAALAVLVEPGRLAHAQDVVVHAAPALQRVLADALAEGGWFGEAYDAEVGRIVRAPEESERTAAVSTLVAEQTRLGMFVGVAVGFELAHELASQRTPDQRDQCAPDQRTAPNPDQPTPDADESGSSQSQ